MWLMLLKQDKCQCFRIISTSFGKCRKDFNAKNVPLSIMQRHIHNPVKHLR